MADDLRHFLSEQTISQSARTCMRPRRALRSRRSGSRHPRHLRQHRPRPRRRPRTSQPIKIVPKGLRSFDAHDADFFLELLPGPRDRDGLPDSLRFWKTRIEADRTPTTTFKVGLIYGPSGCGKSSLVKAGLAAPAVGKHVIAVYVEATAEETETRLLNGLRKRCPELPEDLGLIDSLAHLRRGRVLPPGKKVLHRPRPVRAVAPCQEGGSRTRSWSPALRQCDGEPCAVHRDGAG